MLRAMRRRGSMEGLANLVTRVFPGRAPHERELLLAHSFWCRCVPERVVENARPAHLQRGVLTVHTKSAAWANTLQLESETLLRALRSRYPSCGVHRLVFRAGPMPALPLPPSPPPPKAPVVPLHDLPESVARELAHIRSDRVRDAVRRAASVGLADEDSP